MRKSVLVMSVVHKAMADHQVVDVGEEGLVTCRCGAEFVVPDDWEAHWIEEIAEAAEATALRNREAMVKQAQQLSREMGMPAAEVIKVLDVWTQQWLGRLVRDE